MMDIDIYKVNAILCSVNSTIEDVSASNGESLVAFVELIRQTLEPLRLDLRPDFKRAIVDAIQQDDPDALEQWLCNPVFTAVGR